RSLRIRDRHAQTERVGPRAIHQGIHLTEAVPKRRIEVVREELAVRVGHLGDGRVTRCPDGDRIDHDFLVACPPDARFYVDQLGLSLPALTELRVVAEEAALLHGPRLPRRPAPAEPAHARGHHRGDPARYVRWSDRHPVPLLVP